MRRFACRRMSARCCPKNRSRREGERRERQRTCWLEWRSSVLVQRVALLENDKRKREKKMLSQILKSWCLQIQRKSLNSWCRWINKCVERRKKCEELKRIETTLVNERRNKNMKQKHEHCKQGILMWLTNIKTCLNN